MRYVVCIKQVPETTDVKINPETNTLMRDGVVSIINPFDMYAIEEGLRLKAKTGGTVTVLSMGPPQADAALREAIAMGADDGILLSDRAFAGSDTWATSYTLAMAIRKIGNFDLILCGKQASDGDTAQSVPASPFISTSPKSPTSARSSPLTTRPSSQSGSWKMATKSSSPLCPAFLPWSRKSMNLAFPPSRVRWPPKRP